MRVLQLIAAALVLSGLMAALWFFLDGEPSDVRASARAEEALVDGARRGSTLDANEPAEPISAYSPITDATAGIARAATPDFRPPW